MLFKKQKDKNQDIDILNHGMLALTSLVPLCSDGRVSQETFMIKDKGICVYADVVSLKDNVAQIVYQLHHSWLEEPIVESVAAAGTSMEDAIHQAAQSFYNNILSQYVKAVQEPSTYHTTCADGKIYDVYRGRINGVGKREGTLEGDFWDMLKDDIIMHLCNRKAHWIRIFASKNKDNIICEVRIDGQEVSELSEKLITYAENWDTSGSYYSEKQGILLIQQSEVVQETKSNVMDDVDALSNKAMNWLEECHSKEEYAAIRKKLYQLCKNEALTNEIFCLVPEIYAMYYYQKVEFGDMLYLIRKGEVTQEVKQSEVTSFQLIKNCVYQRLGECENNQKILNVLQYSSSARAIRKALEEGDNLYELMIPGFGISIPKDYPIH